WCRLDVVEEYFFFFFSSRRRHTRWPRDWSSDVCSSDLELAALKAKGFTKARIDGQFRSLEETINLDRRRNHTIEIVVDRLIVKRSEERRVGKGVDVGGRRIIKKKKKKRSGGTSEHRRNC